MHASSRFQVGDLCFTGVVMLVSLPFFLSDWVVHQYSLINNDHGILMSFLKFAVLATMGEVIGLRIKTGNYHQPGFGYIPRAVVWGFLGVTIHLAFVVFPFGVTQYLEHHVLPGSRQALLSPGLNAEKILVAFSISLVMNLVYAPVMMTLHKITDTHISNHKGSVKALARPIPMGMILSEINWEVQWGFVFKKTIPFFWIPAHTITFLLPGSFRVLFAALLSIMLGVILAVAAVMGKEKH